MQRDARCTTSSHTKSSEMASSLKIQLLPSSHKLHTEHSRPPQQFCLFARTKASVIFRKHQSQTQREKANKKNQTTLSMSSIQMGTIKTNAYQIPHSRNIRHNIRRECHVWSSSFVSPIKNRSPGESSDFEMSLGPLNYLITKKRRALMIEGQHNKDLQENLSVFSIPHTCLFGSTVKRKESTLTSERTHLALSHQHAL